MKVGAWCRTGFVALGLVVAVGACGDDGASPAGGGGSGAGGVGGAGGAGGGEPLCEPGSHETEDGACAADLIEWATGPSLPERRDHHATAVVAIDGNAFLTVLGGGQDNADVFAMVTIAKINADGSLGAWAEGTELPHAAAGSGVAVVGDTLLFSGGYRLGAVSASLSKASEFAVMAPDGTLGAWSDGPQMSVTRFHQASIAVGSDVYVVGGMTGNNTVNTAVVERTRLENGSFAPWSTVTPLPDVRSHHSLAEFQGALYVSGGLRGNPSGTYESLTDILRAPIEADGSLGEWTQVGELPVSLSTHATFVFAGQLYAVGGIENDSVNTSHVRRAPIAEDGTVGVWENVAELPAARAHAHHTPVYGGFVYSAGGALNHNSIDDVWIGRFE